MHQRIGMMANDSERNHPRTLPVWEQPRGDEACTTCQSQTWIWEEEVHLVRQMIETKYKARQARRAGDANAVHALRQQFESLRQQMEKVRRQRLDSLGYTDYD